jgi:heterodisulfide reductase subunit B
MSYLYFPGCSLRSIGRPYEESVLAVFRKLDISLKELEDWNCCGATAYVSIDENRAFTLAARNLALAEKMQNNGGPGGDLMAPCSACYLVLEKTQHYMKTDEGVNREVTAALHRGGFAYRGTTKVRHPLDILVNDIGIERIAQSVVRPMKGMKVACYYGCQVVRPFQTFDHAAYPTTMDRIMTALGATAVDWPMKTRCCGGSLTGTIQEAGLRLNRSLLKEATTRGANIILTCCPLCQHNLECYQKRINRRFGESIRIPVAYFTQFIGLALGIPEKELGIQRLFIPLDLPALPGKDAHAHA